MHAFVFPGQAAQFPGMGLHLFHTYASARKRFEQASDILGYNITAIMFEGSKEELRQTKITQPAVFLHSIIAFECLQKTPPLLVAGHSLGELSALVAAKYISFEQGLRLVKIRSNAMQKACEQNPSTMSAIIGCSSSLVEEVCLQINDIVVPANYNAPGQIIISGSIEGVKKASLTLKKAGARLIKPLDVGGGFHSLCMLEAKHTLSLAIDNTPFQKGLCPIYQNVYPKATTDISAIKTRLKAQMCAPVQWVQTIEQMIADGAEKFIEIGPGNILTGLIKRIDKDIALENKG